MPRWGGRGRRCLRHWGDRLYRSDRPPCRRDRPRAASDDVSSPGSGVRIRGRYRLGWLRSAPDCRRRWHDPGRHRTLATNHSTVIDPGPAEGGRFEHGIDVQRRVRRSGLVGGQCYRSAQGNPCRGGRSGRVGSGCGSASNRRARYGAPARFLGECIGPQKSHQQCEAALPTTHHDVALRWPGVLAARGLEHFSRHPMPLQHHGAYPSSRFVQVRTPSPIFSGSGPTLPQVPIGFIVKVGKFGRLGVARLERPGSRARMRVAVCL
jgi:hypothetical protein